jgi:hypothetical protein
LFGPAIIRWCPGQFRLRSPAECGTQRSDQLDVRSHAGKVDRSAALHKLPAMDLVRAGQGHSLHGSFRSCRMEGIAFPDI